MSSFVPECGFANLLILCHSLPVQVRLTERFFDPSHGFQTRSIVLDMATGAVCIVADGLPMGGADGAKGAIGGPRTVGFSTDEDCGRMGGANGGGARGGGSFSGMGGEDTKEDKASNCASSSPSLE